MELICVIGCIGVVIGMLGGGNWHVQHSMQVRGAAAEFLQTVKTARQYAVDRGCRVRITFRQGFYSDDAAVRADEHQRTYRIHAFIVPGAVSNDHGRWTALPGTGEGAKAEWTRVDALPRSVSLVGRWMACDLDPQPRKVGEAIRLASPLFDRFSTEEAKEFNARNFFTPDSFWSLDESDPHEAGNCFAVYPEDFHLTPTDLGPALLSGLLPEDERCLDPMTGRTVEARTFWPGEVRFIRGGDPKALEALPGIEFQPDGSLVCDWKRELEFSFSRPNNVQPKEVVLIDVTTGLARIAQQGTP